MNVQLLLQIAGFAVAEIVPVEELVARLKTIFTLNPNAQVSIQNLESEAIQADDDTLAMIAKWQQEHGLPVTVAPPGRPVVPITQSVAGEAGTNATAENTSAAAAAPAPAVSETPSEKPAAQSAESAAVGETGEHGEVGDLGSNKPAKS